LKAGSTCCWRMPTPSNGSLPSAATDTIGRSAGKRLR
jgi:hypothetical protein